MRIGIFGGSFNPIHYAHINIARYILKKLQLDKLIVIPVGKASHKNVKMADPQLRLEMCRKAFETDEKITVSDIEIKSNKVSYTVDTLKKLISLYGGHNEFYEIIGEDSADTLDTWKNYKDILKLSKIVVFRRAQYKNIIHNKNILYLDTPLYELSSTMIRQKINKNEDVSQYIPKEVFEIISKNNLYKQDRKEDL
ncbi:nicotinate-nucleotide adenylyltransferase [Fusobacterium sp.]|uniref:nicotinate-nucleotide adenylyltransferase n=1 Tax=Fusobacterium sp. TaxID=68766 RepID=UPI00396C5433